MVNHNNEIVRNENCGFNVWADHHWAYDHFSEEETLTMVEMRAKEAGYKFRYVAFPGDNANMYVFDPSGWTLQLDIPWGSQPKKEVPFYSASCESNDGCRGQGIC